MWQNMEQAIKQAVENFPDTKWRIVTIHQDIYGSGLDHSGYRRYDPPYSADACI